MADSEDRRQSKRIRFMWPLWFGYDAFGEFNQAQAVDIGTNGVSFTVNNDRCPAVGDHVLTRFSYPIEDVETFEMDSFQDWCEVIRVEPTTNGRNKVALRLRQPVNCFGIETEAKLATVSA